MGSWRGFVIPGRSQPNSPKMKGLLGRGQHEAAHPQHEEGRVQVHAGGRPELDLPPFRYMNRFTNSLVSMANSRSQDQDLYKMMKFMMMMKMMQQVGSDNQDHHSF